MKNVLEQGKTLESDELEIFSAKFWLGEDSILRTTALPPAIAHSRSLKQTHSAKFIVNQEYSRPVLADLCHIHSTSTEGREFYSKDERLKETIWAIEMVVNSPFSKLIGNLFLGINKLPI